MARGHDSEGKLLPIPEATSEEIASTRAYLGVVSEPDDGFSLSQLRQPGSSQSLQSLERVANALVSSGFLFVETVQSSRGIAYKKYHKVGS